MNLIYPEVGAYLKICTAPSFAEEGYIVLRNPACLRTGEKIMTFFPEKGAFSEQNHKKTGIPNDLVNHLKNELYFGRFEVNMNEGPMIYTDTREGSQIQIVGMSDFQWNILSDKFIKFTRR